MFGWWFGQKHVFLLGTVHILGWRRVMDTQDRPKDQTCRQLGKGGEPCADENTRTIAALRSGKPGKRITKQRC